MSTEKGVIMSKKHGILMVLLTAVLMCVAGSAMADDSSSRWRAGFGMDLGVPSGIALGFVLHPATDALSLEAAFTENVLSPGGRMSLKLDPMALAPRLPVGLFLDAQAGAFGRGSVLGRSNLPHIGYSYENLFLGLRLGKASGFNWFFEGGFTHLNVTTSNFQAVLTDKPAGLTVGNPYASAWALPGALTGFNVVW